MDDRKVDNSKPASELDGPGIAYKVYLDCERVIEKLKILNYEKDYVNLSTSFRTVPRLGSFNINISTFLLKSFASRICLVYST